jgi:DNA-binding beta-propeller fold protein YncE
MSFGGDANAVAVDSQDRVYVFNRGPHPMLIFKADGSPIGGWGDGEFVNPHAVTIDPDDNIFLVDSRGGHVVQKRSLEGRLLMQIGTFGQPAEKHSGAYFHSPTDVAVHPVTRELFVTDGYGNSRVHRFSPEGEHILSWGESGGYPGQFCLPHGIAFLDDEHVVVCDRENYRLQIFTLDGRFVDQWHTFRPCAIRRSAINRLFYVAELGPGPSHHGLPNLGNRIVLINDRGETVARFGSPLPGAAPDQFIAPHGLALDSKGDLYVAEVRQGWSTGTLGLPVPVTEEPSLRKWDLVMNVGVAAHA